MLSFLCLLVIILITSQTTAKLDYENTTCISSGPDYAPNSTYQTNLNTLLSKLTSNTQVDYGYYSSSYGQDPDTVYATGLCRGDVAPDTCRRCLNDSCPLLLQHCPQRKGAIVVNDQCMLHYTNYSIDVCTESDYRVYFLSETNVTDWDEYSYLLTKLLSRLRGKATTSGDPNRKFAAGHVTSRPSSQSVYAVVQCQPDLTAAQCNDCLVGAFSELPKCCYNKSGGAVIKFNCNFRYENSRFYEATADALTISLSPHGSPLPSPHPTASSITTEPSKITYHGKSNRSVIAKAVPAAAFVVLLNLVCIYLRVRKSTKHFESNSKREEAAVDNEIKQAKSSQFDFDTISVATNHFSDSNKLGQGGFGPVYKGMLSNEQEIAVKRLSHNSGQGDTEFKNEVLLMTRLQHRNLVRLLGFCFERQERLLVYEFLPHKSLDYFLFDPIKQAHLDWKTRYKIIAGIAYGLLYLHEDSQQRIIHRDLKCSNILLDADMNPVISDFGLARLFDLDQTQAIASKIVGTFGYMAPEYVRHGKFSVKLDVFSFGVIILEIVTGQKNSRFHYGGNAEHLLSFAWKNWRKGTSSNIIDPTLDDGSRNEIERCIHIGLLCVQQRAAERPTLGSVLLMLNSQSFHLPVPLQPAFFMNDKSTPNIQFSRCSSMEIGSSEQKSNSDEASINVASISSLYAR